MELIRLNEENRQHYEKFDRLYQTELKQYQTRIYPIENAEQVSWYLIEYSKRIIGSVWLEMEKGNPYAVLGIFIADAFQRGQGIGRQAIRQIIKQDACRMGAEEIRLHVRADNCRAFHCYRAVGFQEVDRFVNPNGIPVIVMSLHVADFIMQQEN